MDLFGKGLLATGVAGIGMWQYITQIEPGWIELNEVRLALKRLPSSFNGLRMVQVSDIHMGNWMDREQLNRIVELVLGLKPDLVAMTGDYVSGHRWKEQHTLLLADLAQGLRPLADACPVVAVLGNHDHSSRASAVRAMLAQAGVIDLSNTVTSLERGGERLHLAGVDSVLAGKDRLDQVLRQLPEEGAPILLAHEPDFADISSAAGCFDLQISGHSHGGQVVLPLVGAPVLPKYARKYPSGLYQVGNMHLYTNRGVGLTWKMVRFNCRPEITSFILQADQA